MSKIQIIYPIFPIAFLSLLGVLHYMYTITKEHRKIESKWFKNHQGEISERMEASRVHYKNLFELPTLFFLLCITIYLLDQVHKIDLIMAWSFVVFKIINLYVNNVDKFLFDI